MQDFMRGIVCRLLRRHQRIYLGRTYLGRSEQGRRYLLRYGCHHCPRVCFEEEVEA